MSLLKLEEVKPGMRLEQPVFDPHSDVCLLKADTILTNRNLDTLKELGILQVGIADRNTILISPIDKMEESLVEDFIHILRQVAPRRPEANKNDNVVKVAAKLEKLIRQIAKSEAVLKFLVEMRIIDKLWLYDHSIYTAVLSGLVAGSMDLRGEELLATVVGALLHNIGVEEMPMLIRLTDYKEQQRKLWEEHPTYGYYFAMQNNIPKVIADCIHAHHEKYDGSGYPKGLKKDEIPLPARIVAVCSNYAAAVVYKNIPPYMAVEEIYGTSGIYYDPDVVKAFVNNIPIYPLGVMVRLSTKEVGIVSNIRKNEGPRPIVKIYYNRVNRSVTEERVVDLGKERTIFIEELL